jgi:hypothetical protein
LTTSVIRLWLCPWGVIVAVGLSAKGSTNTGSTPATNPVQPQLAIWQSRFGPA